MIPLARTTLLALAIPLFTGCAANVVRTGADPQAGASTPSVVVPKAAASRLVLMLDGSPDVRANADWPALVEEWNTAMAETASAADIAFRPAKTRADVPAGAGTLLVVKVNDFRYVSHAKRYALGVMTGNASMDLTAEYFQLPERKPLGTSRFSTSSSAWQGVFSAMTPKQVRTIAADLLVPLKDGASGPR